MKIKNNYYTVFKVRLRRVAAAVVDLKLAIKGLWIF